MWSRQRPLDVKFQVATQINRFVLVKAAADEACSAPSLLNIALGGNSGAQCNMDHGSKTLAPTPSNEPEAMAAYPDPGPLSRGAVGPIPDVLEQCRCNSLTRTSAGQPAQNRETGSSLRSLAVDADASFDVLDSTCGGYTWRCLSARATSLVCGFPIICESGWVLLV